MEQVVTNYEKVKKQVEEAHKKFYLPKRKSLPEIIAVSKTHGPEKILPLLECSQRVFGENRVQEAKTKWPSLKKKYPDIELHLIGPLQTNKVREALELFNVIETLDREKLALELKKEKDKTGKCPPVFIQVNTGEEEQKAGISPDKADAFIKFCKDELGLPVIGLMCIPPIGEEPALHFALLKKIAKRNGIEKLSMGMSGDFETAAAMGATHLRIGSAIFGERN